MRISVLPPVAFIFGAVLSTCDVSAAGQVEAIAIGRHTVRVGSGGAQ